MLGKTTGWIKLITVILAVAFSFENVLWASPEVLQREVPADTLQIPAKFNNPLALDNPEFLHKALIETGLKYIVESAADIEKFKYRIMLKPYEGVNAVLDFSEKAKKGDSWVVPCYINDIRKIYNWKYEAVINPDKSIFLRKPCTITPISVTSSDKMKRPQFSTSSAEEAKPEAIPSPIEAESIELFRPIWEAMRDRDVEKFKQLQAKLEQNGMKTYLIESMGLPTEWRCGIPVPIDNPWNIKDESERLQRDWMTGEIRELFLKIGFNSEQLDKIKYRILYDLIHNIKFHNLHGYGLFIIREIQNQDGQRGIKFISIEDGKDSSNLSLKEQIQLRSHRGKETGLGFGLAFIMQEMDKTIILSRKEGEDCKMCHNGNLNEEQVVDIPGLLHPRGRMTIIEEWAKPTPSPAQTQPPASTSSGIDLTFEANPQPASFPIEAESIELFQYVYEAMRKRDVNKFEELREGLAQQGMESWPIKSKGLPEEWRDGEPVPIDNPWNIKAVPNGAMRTEVNHFIRNLTLDFNQRESEEINYTAVNLIDNAEQHNVGGYALFIIRPIKKQNGQKGIEFISIEDGKDLSDIPLDEQVKEWVSRKARDIGGGGLSVVTIAMDETTIFSRKEGQLCKMWSSDRPDEEQTVDIPGLLYSHGRMTFTRKWAKPTPSSAQSQPPDPISSPMNLAASGPAQSQPPASELGGMDLTFGKQEHVSLTHKNKISDREYTYEGYRIKEEISNYGAGDYKINVKVFSKNYPDKNQAGICLIVLTHFKAIVIERFYPGFPKEKKGRGRGLLRYILNRPEYAGYDVIASGASNNLQKSFLKMSEFNPTALIEGKTHEEKALIYKKIEQKREEKMREYLPTLNTGNIYQEQLPYLDRQWRVANIHGVVPIQPGEFKKTGPAVHSEQPPNPISSPMKNETPSKKANSGPHEKLRLWAKKHSGGMIDKSQRELAKEHGVSLTAVQRILKKYEILSKGSKKKLPKDMKSDIEKARDDFIVKCLLEGQKTVIVKGFREKMRHLYNAAYRNKVYLPVSKAYKNMYLLFGFEVPQTDADELCITDEDLKKSFRIVRARWHTDRVHENKEKKLLYSFWFNHVDFAYKKLCRRREWLKKTSADYFPGIGRKRLPVPELVSSPMEEPMPADNAPADVTPLADASLFLRDISNPEQLTRNMLEAIMSILLSGKKLVLAFNKNMRGFEFNKQLVRRLEALKEEPEFEKLLQNLIIIESFDSSQDLSAELNQQNIDVEDSENNWVFTFAPSTKKDELLLKPQIHAVFIDEGKDFNPSIFYYPLFEIVTIAIVKYHREYTVGEKFSRSKIYAIFDKLGIDKTDLNIQDINDKKSDAYLIFTLIPKVSRYKTNERVDRYTLIKKYIESAV